MPDLNIDCIARRGRNLVGFSGGPDSLCLLQMLADGAWRRSVVPVHIDHGLDAGSAGRAAAAQSLAEALGFDCEVVRVSVNPNHRNGPEAAARHARYAHFEAILKAGDHLLTAHHADDQLETVIMRLNRSSGVAGLAGIRARTLVIVGEQDTGTPPSAARAIAGAIAGARLETIPGAAHLSNIEQAETFNRLLIEFLAAARTG